VPGPLGESLGADAAEHVVGRAQLLTGFAATALPAQPFPVQQAGAGQVHRDTAAGKALDGFTVAGIGCLAVAQQRAGAGRGPQSPLGPAGPCSLVQLPERGSRGIGFAGSDVGLDKLDQRPAE
jgi:hypothetical protein